MLSKKMTFSLMSLITLLAFAFVVPSAIAQDEFKVEFEGRTSVNVDTAVANRTVTLKVTTGQPVADAGWLMMISNVLGLTVLVVDRNGLAVTGYIVGITEDTDFEVMKTAKVRRFTISFPGVQMANQGNLPYTKST